VSPLAVAAALVLSASSIRVELAQGLSCPTAASLTRRLTDAGLSSTPDLTNHYDFELTVAPADQGALQLTVIRTRDKESFKRTLPAGDCNTVERVIITLVHSWVRVRLPPLRPGVGKGASPDGGG